MSRRIAARQWPQISSSKARRPLQRPVEISAAMKAATTAVLHVKAAGGHLAVTVVTVVTATGDMVVAIRVRVRAALPPGQDHTREFSMP